jgi:putative ABC transport system permease protein
LAPSIYGYYSLRWRGGISFLGRGGAGDPFHNPLLFLVPTLFAFSLALLFIRLFPLLMEAMAWVSEHLPSTTLLLALRHLSRSPTYHTGPLLLLILTLSLVSFTSSMARTFDSHLSDSIYYRVGADLNLAEIGEREEGEEWLFLPVSEHLKVPGVRAATRVGDYIAIARLGERMERGRFLGIDRVDFPKVAFFRNDFAPYSLGALMNLLALRNDALLVSRPFLSRHGLDVGDRLILTIDILGERREIEFTIACVLDLFPTLYPEDGPFFVGNLDYIFEQMGGLFPYDVWLALDEGADPEAVVQEVRELGIPVISAGDARSLIAEGQTRPERQGFFGLLSVGFVASAVLTVVGFLLYSAISFWRRFVELGILRAIGLSMTQIGGLLTWEQLIITLIGLVIGAGLGIGAAFIFIPFMQVEVQTPPFVIEIAWDHILKVCSSFAGMSVVTIVIVVISLTKIRMYEAVKIEAE